MNSRLPVAILLLLAVAACSNHADESMTVESQEQPPSATARETVAATAPAGGTMDEFSIPANLESTPSGLRYSIERPGDGPQPEAGQTVSVHYSGWLFDGTPFDSSRDRGRPLEFPLGQGRVIQGWDEGIAAMRIGEVRWLVIPPDLGYGARGTGGVIPPNATLVFRVELLGAR